MCGINGIFAYHSQAAPVDRGELLRSRDWMIKRGPDGYGERISDDRRVGLAHRRLAIIDLSDLGLQPMTTENDRFQIVFNGEIYNYKELRSWLEDKGIRFRSQTDTEVLLYLYQQLGGDLVHRLRGMFAFAIWDADRRELFLARDPYGIKPLYYCDDGRTFRFASQVKALQAGGAISRAVDPAGVTGFFLWGSVPEPRTVYDAVRALPAGSTMRVGARGAAAPERYRDLAASIVRSCELAASLAPGAELEHVREALVESVRLHTIADVPLGAFLSAGLDSSTVVALACEVSSKPLQTITLSFEEFEGRDLDEAPVAQQIAELLGVRHRCLKVTLADAEADLAKFINAMDQPTIDGLNTWFVSKAAAQAGLKVALSGLGGDELLGGYSTFNKIPRQVAYWRRPSKVPLAGDIFRMLYSGLVAPYTSFSSKYAGVIKLGGSYEGAYQLQRGLFMPWELRSILHDDLVEAGISCLQADSKPTKTTEGLSPFAQVAWLESSRYLRNQLLRDADWCGMNHSLEIRVPLVDSVLIDKIVGLSALGRLGEGKAVFAKSVRRPLPVEALVRPKTGFTIPIWRWLRKSEFLASWKRMKVLQRANIGDECRWAYSIFAQLPEASGALKTS